MAIPMPMQGQLPGAPQVPPSAAPPAASPGAEPAKRLGLQAMGMGAAQHARDLLSIAVPMLHGSDAQEAAVKALAILIRALPAQHEQSPAMPAPGAPMAPPHPTGAMQ